MRKPQGQPAPKRAGRPRGAPPAAGTTAALIIAARERAGLTVVEAAQIAGVTPSAWWRWERGDRTEITFVNLCAAARALRCSIVELVPEGG